MIRSYCFDTEKDLDEGIHLLLFAVREYVRVSRVQFELVFGHTVCGLLKLLIEKFLSGDDSSLNLWMVMRTEISTKCLYHISYGG